MQPIIISDVSCLIILDKIGELELLKKLFGQVITTSIVAAEFGEALPNIPPPVIPVKCASPFNHIQFGKTS